MLRRASVFRAISCRASSSSSTSTPPSNTSKIEKGANSKWRVNSKTVSPVRWDQYGNRGRLRFGPVSTRGVPLPPEEVHNADIVSGYAARIFEFEKRREHVRTLPTVWEKVDYVTPHERPWQELEQRWWRRNQPPMFVPRHAWHLKADNLPYDSRTFIEYLTRTHALPYPQMDKKAAQDALVVQCAKVVEETMRETLAEEYARLEETLAGQPNPPPSLRTKGEYEIVDKVIQQAVAAVQRAVGGRREHLAACQVDHNAPLDSFFTRAGFQFVYERHPTEVPTRLLGDHRRYGGELAFRVQETSPCVVRCATPMSPWSAGTKETGENMFHWLTEGVAKRFEEGIIGRLTPESYGFAADTVPVDLRCGYDAQSKIAIPQPYVHTIFLNATNTFRNIHKHWQITPDAIDADVARDTLYSQALLGAFSACVTQAYAHGFTCYDDLPYPFTATCIATDARRWMFVTYHLNTVRHLAYDFNEQRLIDHLLGDTDEDTTHFTPENIISGVKKSPANFAWHTDILPLFKDQHETGNMRPPRFIEWHRETVSQLVQHLLRPPMTAQEVKETFKVENLRPYLNARQPTLIQDEDSKERITEEEALRRKEVDQLHPVFWRIKKRRIFK